MSEPGQVRDVEHGSGILILVVGPSGAGKDTLIDAARLHFANDPLFSFPERVITRGDQAGEPHVSVSQREFDELAAQHAFFLHWRAHDTAYGIPADVGRELEAGRLVVINVSRTVIGDARQKWVSLRVINVSAAPAILRERLIERGRESGTALEERLDHTVTLPKGLWVDEIDNSGDRETAIERFVALLESYASESRTANPSARAKAGP